MDDLILEHISLGTRVQDFGVLSGLEGLSSLALSGLTPVNSKMELKTHVFVFQMVNIIREQRFEHFLSAPPL